MSPQPIITSGSDIRAPWSPLGVSLIALFFPAGGAVLTIRNLERLGQVEQRSVRRIVAAAIAVSAIGYAILLITAPRTADGVPQPSSDAFSFLCVGMGFGSYLVQRTPFKNWIRSHASASRGRWLQAVFIALGGQIIVFLCVLPILVVALPLGAIAVGTGTL